MRLDLSLVHHHKLSRNKAQALIEAGLVSVNSVTVTKPSHDISDEIIPDIKEDKRIHWVSRSAQKLEGFLWDLEAAQFPIQITGSTCLDVGSSTWWFTQVLLEHGAKHIDAVDVWTDQLHESIKNDAHIHSYEQTDIREFKKKRKEELSYTIIVCDASFVSLTVIFASIIDLAESTTDIILLWKPQFEVGSSQLRKTWVPKNEKIILQKQQEWELFIEDNNCKVLHKEKSSLMGEAWNQEWVYLIRKV